MNLKDSEYTFHKVKFCAALYHLIIKLRPDIANKFWVDDPMPGMSNYGDGSHSRNISNSMIGGTPGPGNVNFGGGKFDQALQMFQGAKQVIMMKQVG